jgi:hypothetical protein
MAREVDQSASKAIARRNSGIENRMVVLPIELLEQTNPLRSYSQARVEEKKDIMEMRQAGLNQQDVVVFESIIRL